MGFLKVITSIAIAILFLIFLNNIMALIFPVSGSAFDYGSNDDFYKKCDSLRPAAYDYNSNIDYNSNEVKAADAAYQKCIDEKRQEANDKKAIENQYIWLRAIVVLLILVGSSVLLFKKYPFYGGALIGGGLLFTIAYPLFARTGFSFDVLFNGGDVSEGVRKTTQLIKMIASCLGVAGLSAADLFFFEKHHLATSPEAKNFTQNQPEPPVSSGTNVSNKI